LKETVSYTTGHKYKFKFIDILLNRLDGVTINATLADILVFLFLGKLRIELCKCLIIEENYRED
jgi:hypothetical protein